jgi:hypothetical protein
MERFAFNSLNQVPRFPARVPGARVCLTQEGSGECPKGVIAFGFEHRLGLLAPRFVAGIDPLRPRAHRPQGDIPSFEAEKKP